MRRPWITILGFELALLSATGFWAPDTLVHAIRAYKFESSGVIVISIVMPLSLLLVLALAKRAMHVDPLKHIGAILAGVWFLGGLFMMLGASFSGGGFNGSQGWRWAITSTLLSLFPPYTFVLAIYDGSLLALLLVTAIGMIALTIRSRGLMENKSEVRYHFKR